MNKWETGRLIKPHDVGLLVKKLDERAKLPTRGTAYSAGFDLCSVETVVLYPGDIRLVHTGIAVEIPMGFYGHLTARSSLGKFGVRVAGGTSVIDADYRGEVLIYFINDGANRYVIDAGERVAQMVIQPFLACDVIETDNLSATARGTGGFGSTGK